MTTYEWLWNPAAYDPKAATSRAVKHLVGEGPAALMERLLSAFTGGTQVNEGTSPRWRHQLWREGKVLESVEPDNAELADFYVQRLKTISETLPTLQDVLDGNEFFDAVKSLALKSVDIAQAYLETYVLVKSTQQGDIEGAIAAGDRAEKLLEDWGKHSTGNTDLHAPNERRDSQAYLEEIDVRGRVRALRRGGEEPAVWIVPPTERTKTHLGRKCASLADGSDIRFPLRASGAKPWLVPHRQR